MNRYFLVEVTQQVFEKTLRSANHRGNESWNNKIGAVEMAHSVKCLVCKHKDLSWTASTHEKNWLQQHML